MRLLALLVVVGCAGAEQAVPESGGGSSQGGMPASSAGAAGVAGAGAGGALGGGGSGGVAGGSSGAPAAGTGGAELGGSGGGKPVDGCPEVKACTEKCTLMVPGEVLPGNHCALGSFSCGETLGYYASDGMEWTFVTATSAQVSMAAAAYCAPAS